MFSDLKEIPQHLNVGDISKAIFYTMREPISGLLRSYKLCRVSEKYNMLNVWDWKSVLIWQEILNGDNKYRISRIWFHLAMKAGWLRIPPKEKKNTDMNNVGQQQHGKHYIHRWINDEWTTGSKIRVNNRKCKAIGKR